ncbi:hypothetical protein HYT25_01115 [Candidatus Pacearchaeota archaeon]|nr:hypothetical protein [Candidatus Pacearchaeota archaeon]
MVKIDEETVYESLTTEWQSGADIYVKLVDSLGLGKLRWRGKLNYLFNFQTWYVSVNKMHECLENLREEGFAARRIMTIELYGKKRPRAEYKKTGRIKGVKVRIGKLEESLSAA